MAMHTTHTKLIPTPQHPNQLSPISKNNHQLLYISIEVARMVSLANLVWLVPPLGEVENLTVGEI